MSWFKEPIDQSLHALWTWLTFFLPWVAWKMPMPMWDATFLTIAAVCSLVALCVREVRQKSDQPGGILHNWPWTDTCGYLVGAALGTIRGVVL